MWTKTRRPWQGQVVEVTRLQQENERLKAQLSQAELIITAQKTLTSFRANLEPEPGMTLMITEVKELAQRIGITQAFAVFDFPRSSLYRRRHSQDGSQRSRPTPQAVM